MRRQFLLVGSLLLAACSTSSPSATNVLPHAAQAEKALFTIRIPHTAPSARHAQWISASTQSMSIAISPAAGCGSCSAATTVPANLTPSSPGCSAASGGSVSCTVSASLVAGSYTADVQTFDRQNEGGNLLASAQNVPFTIAAGQANTIKMTLTGVAASMSLSLNGASSQAASLNNGTLLIDGANATAQIAVSMKDADGNVILLDTPSVTVKQSGAPFSTSYDSSSQNLSVTTPAHGTKAAGQINASISGCAACSAQITAYITPIVGIYDYGNSSVSVYNTRTKSMLAGPIVQGTAQNSQVPIAFDTRGNLFAVRNTVSPDTNAIVEYAPPYTGSPLRTISLQYSTNYLYPNNLAFDANDDLFIADGSGNTTVEELAPPYSTAVSLRGPVSTFGYAFVDSNGNLWVSDDGNQQVLYFAAPVSASTVPAALPIANSFPGAIIESSGDSVLVCDYASTNIYQFTLSGGTQPSIASPGCHSLAQPPLGGLLVANSNSTCIYTTLTGSCTQDIAFGDVLEGRSMDVDAFGNAYIADEGFSSSPPAVYVLTAPYTGTPQPIPGTWVKPSQLAVWP
jgi:uncharacterized lipoprotein YajG